jgi:hypothetical protein
MLAAHEPQTTFSPCRPLAADHLIRHALVAPQERRDGPLLLQFGPHRAPWLLSSDAPQPSLATCRPSLRLETHHSFESRAVRQDSGLDKPPHGNEQLACSSDDPEPAESATAVAKARRIPLRQRTRRLKAEPPPGHLNGPGTDVVISDFGEATLIDGVPPRSGRGGQAAERPDCFAMANGPLSEACQDTAPGTIGSNPFAGQEWPHFCQRRVLARRHQRVVFGFQLAHALSLHLDLLPLLAEPVPSAAVACLA